MHERAHHHHEAVNTVAHSCGLLNHLNCFCRGMFKLNTKFDADLLLYSVILNAMATQCTCSLNSVYAPTDYYSEVILVHTSAFQSTLLGCQITSMSPKLFSLYLQWLKFLWKDLIYLIHIYIYVCVCDFTHIHDFTYNLEQSEYKLKNNL